jgi:Uma2 family endonuclease
MAEPARKAPTARREPGHVDDEPGITLLRWIEGPEGRMEQVELPLTPELFLHPRIGDQMTQGRRHGETAADLALRLKAHFRPAADVLVLFDVKHVFAPGIPEPSPDVSVIRGIRDKDADRESFDVRREGAVPCLIIEVVSPLDSRIRRTDLRDKVDVYQSVGVREYVILDSTRRDRRFRLLGHRLDRTGRYGPIEPDAEGRILSESAGLWFQVSPDGQRVLLFEHPSGRRLLSLEEERESREAAEAEIARLQSELRRLRGDD